MQLPNDVVHFLLHTLIEKRSPAFLRISPEGYLVESGGDVALYGLANLDRATPTELQLGYLAGMLATEATDLCLRFATVAEGIVADVYTFKNRLGAWVVYLDSREESRDFLNLQQQANESRLQLEYSSLNSVQTTAFQTDAKQPEAIGAALDLLQQAQEVLRRSVTGNDKK